jgi:hypothetical protein
VGLERGPLSLRVQLRSYLKEKNSGYGLEIQEYSHRDPSLWPREILYPRKLALTSPTSGGSSVGIVRSRIKATEFVVCWFRHSEIDGGWILRQNQQGYSEIDGGYTGKTSKDITKV